MSLKNKKQSEQKTPFTELNLENINKAVFSFHQADANLTSDHSICFPVNKQIFKKHGKRNPWKRYLPSHIVCASLSLLAHITFYTTVFKGCWNSVC